MAHFAAEAIRDHIGSPLSDTDRALLAVVDECERLRSLPAGSETTAAHRLTADKFEKIIVRELNVDIPLEYVDEFWRWMGWDQ